MNFRSPRKKPEAAIADLGQRFELERIALRLWPSATLIQGLNTALFEHVEGALAQHNNDAAHTRDDPALRAFAEQKVEIRADTALSGSQAKVDLILTDGARLSAHCEHPLGAFENPLSRTQVEQKFRLYAADLLSQAHIEEAIDAVNRLEAFGSVSELMSLLRAGPRTRAMAAAE